ncbi:hypothetical protein [Elizabethkingia anophelis]|uniref:hypothetical protein n=1 Tax=Elizabethkingia anophelis TaxID=1117645 RepID=UPI00301D80AA
MKKKFIIIVLLSSIIVGCDSNHSAQKIDTEKINQPTRLKLDFIAPKAVKNQTLDAIEKKYKPYKTEEFPLSEASISEFRIALYNHFNEQQRHQAIPIKEVTWKINDSMFLTIWFIEKQNKWQQIEQYKWKTGTEF